MARALFAPSSLPLALTRRSHGKAVYVARLHVVRFPGEATIPGTIPPVETLFVAQTRNENGKQDGPRHVP